MAFHIIEEIRKKSREEWHSVAHERWTDIRIWVQEHGEAAFLLGFFVCLFITYFFKFFIALLAIGVIVLLSAYQFTEPEGKRASRRPLDEPTAPSSLSGSPDSSSDSSQPS